MNILDILYVPMGYLIRFAYSITNNYLLAIILFAFVIEILMIPIQVKQQKNQIAQARLQPKVRAITKKYDGRNDQASMQKKQQEIQEMYQKENFNPAGGCLPLLIQLPIILCLYQVIISPLRYIAGVSKEGITLLAEKIGGAVDAGGLGVDLGTNQQIGIINYLKDNGIEQFVSDVPELEGAVLPEFFMGPFDLSALPSIENPSWLLLVPALVFVASYLSTIIIRRFTYQSPETQEAQNNLSMKIMNVSMPLMSTWIAFKVPAAVGCYWVFRNVLSVVERIIISKVYPVPQLSEEEIREIEREYSAKKGKGKSREDAANRPPVRSLHRIDFDDEPLPPPVPEREEDEPAGDSPVDKAPLKDDNKK